jgi:hypothetical protein
MTGSVVSAGLQDILVSFSVTSLFTKVPTEEALHLLSQYFDEETLGLFHHILISSFFNFSYHLYKQSSGLFMGLPFSLVSASFFMNFEKVALEGATQKPLCWFCYMDHSFIICLHGLGKLKEFLDHMNILHRNTLFTIEMGRGSHLPFLDIDICCVLNG